VQKLRGRKKGLKGNSVTVAEDELDTIQTLRIVEHLSGR
jgi:hypothetical protein